MNPSSPPCAFEIGTVLAGKYRVERTLGAGGMGVVVEATHLLLSERVAVKLLLPHVIGDPEHQARFFREAQAAARINSPYVAKVRDLGELDSGEPYIVMELLEGSNLEDLLQAPEGIGVLRTARLALQACEALATAHAAGVIHRDIKASNLFLASAPDGSPLLKIVDFGISKLSALGSTPEASLTATQMAIGSPLTMAPEQMRSAKDVDHRADIWSLGTVLYRCLSGKQPFEAETLPQLCSKVMEAAVIPLEERVPSLPTELVSVIGKCLRRDAHDRYSDVAELAYALAPFAGEGARAAADRCRRILDKNRAGLSDKPNQSSFASDPTGIAQQATAPALPSGGGAKIVAPGSNSPETAAASTTEGAGIASSTDTSFGRTQGRTSPPPSRFRLIGGLSLIGAIGVLALIVFSGRAGRAPNAQVPSASSDVPQQANATNDRTMASASASPISETSGFAPVAVSASRPDAGDVGSVASTPTANKAPNPHGMRRTAVPGGNVDPFSLRK
jgi:eukaryotic-like serine/threonine-protein kinase